MQPPCIGEEATDAERVVGLDGPNVDEGEEPGELPEGDRRHDQVAGVVGEVALDLDQGHDLACGTGYLTRQLRGLVVGLDQSPAMVALAQRRLPDGVALVGDALDPPFADRAFGRTASEHEMFYPVGI